MKSMESTNITNMGADPSFENSASTPIQIFEGLSLSEKEIDTSATAYEAFRNQQDEAVRIGLYGKDLRQVYEDPKTIFVTDTSPSGEQLHYPLLVSADVLEWYNTDVLRQSFPDAKQFYYFAHPPFTEDQQSLDTVKDVVRTKLDEGAVIISDQYESQPGSVRVLEVGEDYPLQNFGEGETLKKADVFAAPVLFPESSIITDAPSLFETYKKAIEDGELNEDDSNGVSLVDVFDKNEAEKLWNLYEAPFARLGAEDPMYAGFDKESFMHLLENPDVAKVVNRVDGNISTFSFFIQDFESCPWFNTEYYIRNYPEYFYSNNILISPGVVTDENIRGSSYSVKLFDFATKLYAKRKSNILITFECTEISTRYIPRIVSRAINQSGIGTVEGLEQPVSTINYLAQQKLQTN